MHWKERITVDSDVLVGKPAIKGTRLSVEFIVELLAQGWTRDQILANHPKLEDDDIQACLHYASELLRTERVYPLPG
jgi:uncharacterized protein (DUF433 family)